METPTISNISKKRNEIKESLRRVRTHDFGGSKYGAEQEFTEKSVIAGIEAILIDAGALCGAPAKFIKMSTSQERALLSNLFDQLLDHCNNLDLGNAVLVLEQIKPVFRAMGVRGSDDRRVAFENHMDELQRKSVALSEEIERLRELKASTLIELDNVKLSLDEAEEKVKYISGISTEIDQQLNTSSERAEKIKEIQAVCGGFKEEIEQLKIGVEASKAAIDEFSKKISQREIQLEDQGQKTKNYNSALNDFTSQHTNKLSEAESLIESARTALGYKTAEGLSAAFTEKYHEAKEDKTTWIWIGFAAVFLICAVGIGVWVTVDSGTGIEIILGRVSLIPILIGGAWFSASQYIKQRNIAEDYAYKNVLARSIVGFSEQISGSDGRGEDHSHYIRTVLSEIHMSPLRREKKDSKDEGSDEIIGLLKEIKEPLGKLIDAARNK